jgi:tetratricopeptide (TPR) repeat protein
MKSRLLFDGGYYQQALDLLQTKKEADYKSTADQLEYCYRSGRILQALFHPNEAISFYSKTIQLGKSSKFYYACNASLQLGIIYEQYKNPLKAKEFYGFCLTLKPDDYMSELHSKAKAGLARVGN